MQKESYHIFVLESGVGAFPRCYTSAATAECDEAGVYVRCAEAVQEVCLACDLAFVEIGVAELANVYLTGMWLVGDMMGRCAWNEPCLGRNRSRRSRSQCWRSLLRWRALVRKRNC
jgi:hypothetical protein